MKQTVLAHVSIRSWGGMRTDAAISDEVAVLKKADRRSGRYVKSLIDQKSLKSVRAAAAGVRAVHYELTRPWDDTGRRLLPAALVEEYTDRVGKELALFHKAADTFTVAYPHLVEEAKARLGDMFDGSQYPSELQIRKTFDALTTFEPMPNGGYLPPELVELGEYVDEIVQRNLKASQDALFHRLYRALQEVRRKIEHYETKRGSKELTRFRLSILDEVKVLVRILPDLNIEGDPFLSGLVDRMENELAAIDPKSFRANDAVRNQALGAVVSMEDLIQRRGTAL